MRLDRKEVTAVGPLPVGAVDVGIDDQSSPTAVVVVMRCCRDDECSNDPYLFTIEDPDLADDVAVSLVRIAHMLRDAQIRRAN